MREQLISYVDLLFAGAEDADDIKQEILQNTLDRYDDLLSQGKSPQAAYGLAISGIGDIGELLETTQRAPGASPTPAANSPADNSKKKQMRAVAIGMYICCVIPVVILGDIGNGTLGVVLMFLLIAAATVLLILSDDGKDKEPAQPKESENCNCGVRKAIQKLIFIVGLCVYFILSFATGAWYITWLIFPIMAVVRQLINACLDLKEDK